jgi:dipeptidyl aminopeptidase/acylaminoacyl peptidase
MKIDTEVSRATAAAIWAVVLLSAVHPASRMIYVLRTRGRIRRSLPWAFFACVAALLVTIVNSPAVGIENHIKRPATVADAIRMTRLAETDQDSGRVGTWSPDGRSVVVVLRRGNIEQNTNEFELMLWKSTLVSDLSGPDVLLTMSSSSNRPAIEQVSWLEDNKTLVFLGEHPGELHQLYAFNIRTQSLQRLTHHDTNLLFFQVTPSGNYTAFVAEAPSAPLFEKEDSDQGVVVARQALTDLIVGRKDGAVWGDPQLFWQHTGSEEERVQTQGGIPGCCARPFSLSPRGNDIVIRLQVLSIPDIWRNYTDPLFQVVLKEWYGRSNVDLLPAQYTDLERYVLINVAKGTNRILLDSPVSIRSVRAEVGWSPDGRSIALGGVYLPLDGLEDRELRERRSKTFAVEIGLENLEVTIVSEAEHLSLRTWDGITGNLEFDVDSVSERQGAVQLFGKSAGRWQELTGGNDQVGRPDIRLEEDKNTPPKIVVGSPSHKEVLLDLNPQFNNLSFGRVGEVEWRGTDGHEVKGGLYYPVDYVSGRRYPLVIQTHGWSANKFWIDGPFTTSFAAQPLAGREIMVLQVDEGFEGMDTPEEVARESAAFEGAVRYLSREGLIDQRRVGIAGFSRTCLFVKYALSHSRYHFAAASVTDGVDAGYFQYLAFANIRPDLAKSFEGNNGGSPFGAGIKHWIERSPGFSVGRVRTPLRIMALDPESILGEWEWFAALTRLTRPVEMIVLQDGSHILQRPSDRIASQQGNVDWFCFWLKGEYDADPAKKEQYERWRRMRSRQHEISQSW